MDRIRTLRKKKIAIIGIGTEGLSLINFLISHKVLNITVCDQLNEDQLPAKFKQIKIPVKKQLGKDYLKNLKGFDIIFRSPGVPFMTSQIQQAKKSGVEISSATKLFFKLCPCEIVGITGTKGKGTTASLLFRMVDSQQTIYLGGNIGKPMLDFLDRLRKDSLVILELSSFQLQDLRVAPKYFSVLNLFCDHLDKHLSFQEYKDAKFHIIGLQKKNDTTVIHESLSSKIKKPKSKLFIFGKDFKDSAAIVGKNKLITNFSKKTIFDLSKTKLLGEHNYLNIAAATLFALLLGTKKEKIEEAIDNFEPLPHRLEFVKELSGIKFYNDSQATIPESTIAAIRSFKEPKVVILGGKSKGYGFSEMVKEFRDISIRRVVVIGENKDEIIRALYRFAPSIKYNIAESLKEAVKLAYSFVKPGDVVLLSPGCASFDMFKSYKERGEKFKKYVKSLKSKNHILIS